MIWYLEGDIIPRLFGRVVDSLKLLVDEVAAGSGQESAMATQRLDSPVQAHVVERSSGVMSGKFCALAARVSLDLI